MSRIPAEELDKLKVQVSLQRLVEQSGVELKRQGKDLVGCCPFHEDDSPSLVVSTRKNLWHCMGACQQGGSVIDWVMKTAGVSFMEAVDKLRATTDLPREVPPPAPRLALDAEDKDLLNQVVDYYHARLKDDVEAQRYLREERGLHSSELVDKFRIGVVDHTLGHHLPHRGVPKGRQMRERLQKLGIMREDTGREHFHGCVVFPLLDEAGQVTGMYGRRMKRSDTPHLYMPGPRRGIFNWEAMKASKEIILCEAVIDALTFWSAGFRNVTCAYGVEGFSQEHMDAFKRHGVERVLIAFDRDDAGDAGAQKLGAKLMDAGMACYRIQFPKGMDANEYARKVTPTERSLALVIRQAEWMGKGAAPADSPRMPEPEVTVQAVQPDPVTSTPQPEVSQAAAEKIPAPLSSVADLLATPTPLMELPTPQVSDQEVILMIGDRRHRVRGLWKNTAMGALRVNVFVTRGERFHGDTFDLAQDRPRAHFVQRGAKELGITEEVMNKDVGQLWMALERLQDENIRKLKEPQLKKKVLNDEERREAMELLKDPKLLDRVLEDFTKCGVVGEEVNKLTGYIAAVSRKLDKPLAVLLQSSSAAGKSSLMEAILAMLPEEEVAKYSAMTGQSLYYMGEVNLKHKILALAEEEGAEKASYALKLLQSEGVLNIASTGKDPATGRLETKDYHVEGPVMIFETTTAIEMDDELLNRCIVLTVDEGREQTRAIHQQQRWQQTREWLMAKGKRAQILKLHQNAQRLLGSPGVFNPYAQELTFPDEKLRLRRDHSKYMTLISSITLLHQYQRERFEVVDEVGEVLEYVEVSADDVRMANKLANQVLGRSLDDLPPQTRTLLMKLDAMVRERCINEKLERSEVRFQRRDAREYTGMAYTQFTIHLQRLVELEYVLPHRATRGQGYVYELIYDGKGKDGAPFLPGLVDVDALEARRSSPSYRGSDAEKSGQNRAQVAPILVQNRTPENGKTPHETRANGTSSAHVEKNALMWTGSLPVATVVGNGKGHKGGNGTGDGTGEK